MKSLLLFIINNEIIHSFWDNVGHVFSHHVQGKKSTAHVQNMLPVFQLQIYRTCIQYQIAKDSGAEVFIAKMLVTV
jgi:hypothetical protein